jgi:hypothetical protein
VVLWGKPRDYSEDQIDEIAKRAIFNGFIEMEDLAYIMAEEECYSEILPRLWRFYECHVKWETDKIHTENYKDRADVWSKIIERMGGILGDKDDIWAGQAKEEWKAWHRKNLKPVRCFKGVYRYSEIAEQPVDNFFDRVESDCVKLEDLKEYIKDLEQVLKIKISLPQRLFPEGIKEEGISENIFHKEGDYWNISYEGKKLPPLRSKKGFHYISLLLQYPNEEFKAMGLVQTINKPSPDLNRTYNRITEEEIEKQSLNLVPDLGNAGKRLDFKAKTDYKKRLAEIEREIEQGEGNPTLLKKLESEKEAIIKELKHAYSRTGQPKMDADVKEKARKAVAAVIKTSIKKINKEHPSLGKHLSDYIKTGNFCSYNPPSDISWKT